MDVRFVQCRFFGGPWDGRVENVHEGLLQGSGTVRVPEPLDILAIAEAYDVPVDMLGPKIHLYCWDGAINDAGERRMRWSGEPR